MWHDPMAWYGVAFVIFAALAVKYVRKPLAGWLDSEIGKIRGELERARQLRAEAEGTLAEYKKKYAQAMRDAEFIVKHAKEEADRLKVQAEADLKAALQRQEQQAAERIGLAETEALAAVRAAAVDAAMESARKTLEGQSKDAGRFADAAIAELPKLAGAKHKAA